MAKFTAKPDKTYALVVGIEKYQERGWNVNGGGPGKDALRFAEWLCQRGVPKENIRLCLSPLDEIEESNLGIEAATEPSISYHITEFFSQKRGDLFYLFWAGHGLITSERQRRLLCADATKQNWQNLDLNSLLVYLSSDRFGIQNHICIVDACANYILESKGRPTNLGGKTFSSGQPRRDCQQFVLLATREGEQAKVSAEGRTGYFSEAVREALAEDSQGFPPDMVALTEKIKQQFKEVDKKQLPTYFYYRTWDGDKGVERPCQVNSPHNIPNSNAREFVDRQQELERLHQLLQENDGVAITDVTGQGGVGKTELAIQYSRRYLENYSGGCCWVSAQGADFLTQLLDFAILNFDNAQLPPSELSQAGRVAYCWRNWQPGNVLVIFDNVTDWEKIKSYLPPEASRFKVIVTTRQQSGLPLVQLPLGELPPSEALTLLAALLGEDRVAQEREFAEGLCKFVGYLPLGLYQIAGLQRQVG